PGFCREMGDLLSQGQRRGSPLLGSGPASWFEFGFASLLQQRSSCGRILGQVLSGEILLAEVGADLRDALLADVRHEVQAGSSGRQVVRAQEQQPRPAAAVLVAKIAAALISLQRVLIGFGKVTGVQATRCRAAGAGELVEPFGIILSAAQPAEPPGEIARVVAADGTTTLQRRRRRRKISSSAPEAQQKLSHDGAGQRRPRLAAPLHARHRDPSSLWVLGLNFRAPEPIAREVAPPFAGNAVCVHSLIGELGIARVLAKLLLEVGAHAAEEQRCIASGLLWIEPFTIG